jgi:hypothetical protein
MDRRKHWDDDLIDAVAAAFQITPYTREVYAVIAAVEDWQRTAKAIIGSSRAYLELSEYASKLERNTNAVRRLHWERVETHTVSHYMTDDRSTTIKHVCDHCNESYPCETIKLLDGK